MAASKNPPVTTPLHLLQQLSQSLLEHLEEACSQALVDAEKLLAKLEKQRSKAQDKLHKASARLEEAAAAGKSKAQAKARTSIAELEELLDTLKVRQTETRDYILRLKSDAEQSLHLAQGIGKVKEATAQLLAERAGTAQAHAPQARPPRRARSAEPPAATPPKGSRGRRAPNPPAAATQPVAPAPAPAPAPVATAEPPASKPARPPRKRSRRSSGKPVAPQADTPPQD